MDAPSASPVSARRAKAARNDDQPFDDNELGLGMHLRTAYFALRRCSNALSARLGSNGDQFILLKVLSDEEGVTQRDLVERGGYDASTTGKMLQQMERQGWIRREPHPRDGRAKRVFLTDPGRRFQLRLWRNSERLRKVLWESLSSRERKVLARSLAQIAVVMEQERQQYEQECKTTGRAPTIR